MAEVKIKKEKDSEKALKFFKYQCRRERILESFGRGNFISSHQKKGGEM